MFYFKILLGLLAVVSSASPVTYATAHPEASAVTKPVESPQSDFNDKRVIGMVVCHLRPSTKHDNASGVGKAVASDPMLFVDQISSDVVPLRDKSMLQRLGVTRLQRSISFVAYFRAPSADGDDSRPLANVEMTFNVMYEPGLKFKWGSSIDSFHFKYIKTLRVLGTQTRLTQFMVTCQPGAVFPITLKVFNFRRERPFHLLGIYAREGQMGAHQEAKAVYLMAAEEQIVRPQLLESIPPVLKLLGSTLGQVLLGRAVSGKTLDKYAVKSTDAREFALTGYFRPCLAETRLVLSSTVSVEVEIHRPTLLGGSEEYLVFILRAQNRLASELILPMNPDLLYKVVVRGFLSGLQYYDFTLVVYDPANEFVGAGVDLMIPALKRSVSTQTGEEGRSANDSSVFNFDSILEYETPSSPAPDPIFGNIASSNNWHEKESEFDMKAFFKGVAEESSSESAEEDFDDEATGLLTLEHVKKSYGARRFRDAFFETTRF